MIVTNDATVDEGIRLACLAEKELFWPIAEFLQTNSQNIPTVLVSHAMRVMLHHFSTYFQAMLSTYNINLSPFQKRL